MTNALASRQKFSSRCSDWLPHPTIVVVSKHLPRRSGRSSGFGMNLQHHYCRVKVSFDHILTLRLSSSKAGNVIHSAGAQTPLPHNVDGHENEMQQPPGLPRQPTVLLHATRLLDLQFCIGTATEVQPYTDRLSFVALVPSEQQVSFSDDLFRRCRASVVVPR